MGKPLLDPANVYGRYRPRTCVTQRARWKEHQTCICGLLPRPIACRRGHEQCNSSLDAAKAAGACTPLSPLLPPSPPPTSQLFFKNTFVVVGTLLPDTCPVGTTPETCVSTEMILARLQAIGRRRRSVV